jgi:hypothetical protein
VKLEDIEVGKLYAIDNRRLGMRPSCGKVKLKSRDHDQEGRDPWLLVDPCNPETGEPYQGSLAQWVGHQRFLMTWSEYAAQQAEEHRAKELEVAAAQETAKDIRDSLRALGVDTFFDIDIDRDCDVVQITLDPSDLATFTAELARAARRILPVHRDDNEYFRDRLRGLHKIMAKKQGEGR